MQFRYQAAGIVMGAVLCVVLASVFMSAYPELRVDMFALKQQQAGVWQSSMTYKFVGAIRGLGHLEPVQIKALAIGLGIGVTIAIVRRQLAASRRYQAFVASGSTGFAVGWTLDAIVFASPYASSTGGFLDLKPSAWFAGGGVLGSLISVLPKLLARFGFGAKRKQDGLPEDMSTASLIGGGLIAGESLYFLGVGIIRLLSLFH